ncbi:MAG TPA: hypothetical protein VHD33_00670 [Legionellaceae bacterium]|nr:hypothetical protein [Legionellaceae bacterium]
MASADVLQRLLDANGNRIANIGAPTTANDATHTDNTTNPSNPAAAASAGTSLLAAPADHVHQAVHSIKADSNAQLNGDVQLASGSGVTLSQVGQVITFSASGGSVNKLTVTEESQKYSSTNTEDILAEYALSFDDLEFGTSANIQARLSGIIKVGGGTGTFNLRVGATSPGATTGSTIRATLSTASTSEVALQNLGAAFANPQGVVIVQVTAQNSIASTKCYIRGFEISIG